MAAAILMFALGALWNQYYNNSDSWSHIMLLYEDENFNEANSKNAFSEYAKWASEVRHRGFKITGEKLGEQKTPVGFSPHHTDNQRLTGYFLIESSSLDQVMQIAKKSPHVKYGGQIEIRTIDSE